MSDNQLLQLIFKACDNFAQCIQTHFSHFIGNAIHSSPVNQRPLFSLNSSPSSKILEKNDGSKLLQRREDLTQEQTKPLTKEELGRATWTLLHMVAAQYPDHPTKQQKRDVKELMAILSRIYPCRDCADHFKEVLRQNHKLSSHNGCAMYTMLSTEVLVSPYSHAGEWMQGGVNWIAKNVHVMFKVLQQSLTRTLWNGIIVVK
ncbi:PREDICTED: FAD-linked sulfhydryl oxidase ERV1 isoform X1 [Nelumbo nucifera]|uniref:Sulfhydryl oxidase n=1 Tax=Nelumbo nucifera TaxID=4432 RepID=A0A1U7ZV01_NELNU|nr:PREDICTED: FAD-linked sulfhydryl oxidase ERV1 isoform X1 [Nelumbo nucifera]